MSNAIEAAAKAIRDGHEKRGLSSQYIEMAEEHGEARFPEVGECLYISGFDGWHLTTPIVKIEEKNNV